MSTALERIDDMIAHKRQELKNLLFARDAFNHLHAGNGAELEELKLLAAPTAEPESEPEAKPKKKRKKPGPKPKAKAAKAPAGRGNLIAERAKRMAGPPVNIPIHKGDGKRRKFTVEQKLAILDEYDLALRKKDVAERYNLSSALISGWMKKRDAGALVPKRREVEAPSFDLPSQQEEDGDDAGDLVSVLEAQREDAPDPFFMGEGKEPNFPSPM